MTVADALLIVAVLAGPIGLGIGEIRYSPAASARTLTNPPIGRPGPCGAT